MEKIAEDREILVTEDEVNGVIADIARRQNMRFDRVRDELMKEDRLGALHMRLRDDKIRDALLADAKITEAPVKKKTAKKAGKKKKKKKSE
jgi:FKBP-type peptidyl-prolyl cis-trans isomerase (trigger factor)